MQCGFLSLSPCLLVAAVIKHESVHRPVDRLGGRLGNGTGMGSRETREQEQSFPSQAGEGCSGRAGSPWEEAQALPEVPVLVCGSAGPAQQVPAVSSFL